MLISVSRNACSPLKNVRKVGLLLGSLLREISGRITRIIDLSCSCRAVPQPYLMRTFPETFMVYVSLVSMGYRSQMESGKQGSHTLQAESADSLNIMLCPQISSSARSKLPNDFLVSRKISATE